MLTWEYPPQVVGGLARHVHALSRELVGLGHRVFVLTRGAEGLPAESVQDGVWVRRVHPYFQDPKDFRLWVAHLNFALLEAGVDLMRTLGSDVIVHAHDWLTAFAARGLKNLFQAPLVATIHATEHGRNGGIHDAGQQYINDVEWWLTYEAWRVVVCSQSMRREVQDLFGLADEKVTVIPNGVDLRDPPREGAPPRERFAAPDEHLLIHVGRLVPEKGAAVLIRALPLLLDRYRVRLVISGVGPYREELVRLAADLGVSDRVLFAGWLPDEVIQHLYRMADVAVVPSLYEPFGIVALEAMAAGTPLVVSDVGGLGEIVTDGETGLKVPPGRPRALAEAIGMLLSHRRAARRMAAAARQRVAERYTWPAVARTTARLYDEVRAARAHTDWGQGTGLLPRPTPLFHLPDRYTIGRELRAEGCASEGSDHGRRGRPAAPTPDL